MKRQPPHRVPLSGLKTHSLIASDGGITQAFMEPDAGRIGQSDAGQNGAKPLAPKNVEQAQVESFAQSPPLTL